MKIKDILYQIITKRVIVDSNPSDMNFIILDVMSQIYINLDFPVTNGSFF